MTTVKPFDPSEHIIKLKGKDYLEVKFRIQWLRSEYPNASIRTELVDRSDKFALFRAIVTIPGGGEATGYGSETPADFGDFIEKAETKAIGRALGALGYGTQFAEDFDMGAGETQRVVDSPVQRPAPRPVTRATAGDNVAPAGRTPPPTDRALQAQRDAITAEFRRLGYKTGQVRTMLLGRGAESLEDLAVEAGNKLLDFLESQATP